MMEWTHLPIIIRIRDSVAHWAWVKCYRSERILVHILPFYLRLSYGGPVHSFRFRYASPRAHYITYVKGRLSVVVIAGTVVVVGVEVTG
jgi:hypothetical protein